MAEGEKLVERMVGGKTRLQIWGAVSGFSVYRIVTLSRLIFGGKTGIVWG